MIYNAYAISIWLSIAIGAIFGAAAFFVQRAVDTFYLQFALITIWFLLSALLSFYIAKRRAQRLLIPVLSYPVYMIATAVFYALAEHGYIWSTLSDVIPMLLGFDTSPISFILPETRLPLVLLPPAVALGGIASLVRKDSAGAVKVLGCGKHASVMFSDAERDRRATEISG